MKNIADICEEAHNLTIKECKEKGIEVDFWTDKNRELTYSKEAQTIFNKHFDVIENEELEKVDEIANQIMDEVRKTFDFDNDLYEKIYNIIKENI